MIGIATNTERDSVNTALEEMGRGPGSMSRPATTEANPGPDATPTHWFMCDQSADEAFLTALTEAALPGFTFSLITVEEALTAQGLTAIPAGEA